MKLTDTEKNLLKVWESIKLPNHLKLELESDINRIRDKQVKNNASLDNVIVPKGTLPDDSNVLGWIKDDFENQTETFVRNPNFKGNAL